MSQIAIISLINFWSSFYNIDPNLAQSVAVHESQLNPSAIGKLNEQGIYQLRPEFYKEYTIEELRNPKINVKLGIQYLAKMKETCVHQNDIEWVICFNMGPSKAKKLKYPALFPYVKAVRELMAINN